MPRSQTTVHTQKKISVPLGAEAAASAGVTGDGETVPDAGTAVSTDAPAGNPRMMAAASVMTWGEIGSLLGSRLQALSRETGTASRRAHQGPEQQLGAFGQLPEQKA